MDLMVIFCCLLLVSLHPAAATSLITGKKQNKTIIAQHNDTKMHFCESPSLVPRGSTSHFFFVTSQRIYSKPEVGDAHLLESFHK